MYCTATSVAAQALATVRIKIHHFKIGLWVLFDQDKSIGTNAKPAMAKLFHELDIFPVEPFIPVIDHDKVIPGPLVFMKFYFLHGIEEYKLQYT